MEDFYYISIKLKFTDMWDVKFQNQLDDFCFWVRKYLNV
jgi:hypothetical protein